MLYQDCDTEFLYKSRYSQIENMFEHFKGITEHADKMKSGNEALTEAFVKMRNQEDIPPIASVLLKTFIGRWKK